MSVEQVVYVASLVFAGATGFFVGVSWMAGSYRRRLDELERRELEFHLGSHRHVGRVVQFPRGV